MEWLDDFLKDCIKNSWHLFIALLLVFIGGIILNEIKQFINWVKTSKSVIKWLELILILFLLLMTYDSFHLDPQVIKTPELYIRPIDMIKILILSAFTSMILYVILIFLLNIGDKRKK